MDVAFDIVDEPPVKKKRRAKCVMARLAILVWDSFVTALWSIMIFCLNKIDLFGLRRGALSQGKNMLLIDKMSS